MNRQATSLARVKQAELTGLPDRGELTISKLKMANVREFTPTLLDDEVAVFQIAMSASDALFFVERANAIISRSSLRASLSSQRDVQTTSFFSFPFRDSVLVSKEFKVGEPDVLNVWAFLSSSLSVDYLRAVERGGRIASARLDARLGARCLDESDGGAADVIKARPPATNAPIPASAQATVVRGRVRSTKQRYDFRFHENMTSSAGEFDVRSYVSLYKGSETSPRAGLPVVIKRFLVSAPASAFDGALVESIALGAMNEIFRHRMSPAVFPTYAIAQTACGRTHTEQFVVMQDLGSLSLQAARAEIERQYDPLGLTSRVYHAIVTQVCVALSILQSTIGLVHADLHLNNVMLTRVPVSSTLTYKYKDTVFDVPTFGYVARIVDFGMSALHVSVSADGRKQWIVRSALPARDVRLTSGMARGRTSLDLLYFCTVFMRERLMLSSDCPVWNHLLRLMRRSFHTFETGGIHTWGWDEAAAEVFTDRAKWVREDVARVQKWFFSWQTADNKKVSPFATPEAWLLDRELSILKPYVVSDPQLVPHQIVYPIVVTSAWDLDAEVEADLRREVDTSEFRRAAQRIRAQYVRKAK